MAKKQDDGRVSTLIVVAVILISAIVLAAYLKQPENPVPVYAPAGQLTPGFPPELVLNADAQPPSSYTFQGQKVAEWQSSFSIDDLYNSYQDYFLGTGWTIENEVSTADTMRGIYATKDAGSANVTMTKENTGSDVIVSTVMN